VSRIRADGVDHDKHTIGLWRQRLSLSLSRQAVPSLNQRSRVCDLIRYEKRAIARHFSPRSSSGLDT
jgi:hypothetical protein